jgi:hypothetical protein
MHDFKLVWVSLNSIIPIFLFLKRPTPDGSMSFATDVILFWINVKKV